jgi:hypothetical protein
MSEEGKEIKEVKAVEAVVLNKNEQAVLEAITGGEFLKYTRVAMAAMGSIPWVGSILAAAATLSAENEQGDTNKLIYYWVREHEEKLKELGNTLGDMFERFESFGDRIKERIESKEYIDLVRKTFRIWDQAETLEKKEMLKKLIINASGISISQDDLVRMFLEWIDKYHEFHFAVVREVYKEPGLTRFEIWDRIRGNLPQDNSAEAHLFKLLISDLNLGEVIHQAKEVDGDGNYLKQRTVKRNPRRTLQSAFEDTKPYVLTPLGAEFVHYVMSDLAPQIEGQSS